MRYSYYLADGIYPEWAVFVKTISLPITEKDKLFAQQQESKRKDIERAFGVLRSRFCILKRPARLYDRGHLEKVVLACIILHNMIVEDEKTDRDGSGSGSVRVSAGFGFSCFRFGVGFSPTVFRFGFGFGFGFGFKFWFTGYLMDIRNKLFGIKTHVL